VATDFRSCAKTNASVKLRIACYRQFLAKRSSIWKCPLAEDEHVHCSTMVMLQYFLIVLALWCNLLLGCHNFVNMLALTLLKDMKINWTVTIKKKPFCTVLNTDESSHIWT